MKTPYVRRAGRATLLDGSALLWSVAEGSHGARWRASTRGPTGLLFALLLEVGTDGRPRRLEITTRRGQLTLHPEPDGRSAHGNVVTEEGVRPLAFPWSPGHWYESRWIPILAAAMVRSLRAEVGVGESRPVPGLQVDDVLRVAQGELRVQHLSEARWSIEDADGSRWELSLDDDGLPAFDASDGRGAPSEAASVWPLEVEPEAADAASQGAG